MVLEKIQKILEKEEFICSLSPANESVPLDCLSVFLNIDANNRERMLEVMAAQQQVAPEFILPKAAELPYRIQFRVQLPFKIQDIALNQVASLILFLNPFIDLPGFELDELDGQVSYRYVWITKPEAIDAPLIMSILGAVMLNLSLFSETIESLADGKISFNDLLSQILTLVDRSKSTKNF